MAVALQKLREQAKKLGVSSKEIRQADRDELESLIADAKNGSGSKKVAKKAVKKAVAKKRTVKRTVAKKSAPAKSTKAKGTAKRQTTRKATAKKSNSTSGYQAKGGRNTLDSVDYGETDGWNPRPGTAPDRIVKALKKFKGNRQKVYEFLLPDIGDFVKTKKRDGSAWEKGEGQGSRKGMLKYRISRTAWQFALQTGQHESSTNRVTYGTGGTGAGVFKRAGRKSAAAKTTTRKATRKAAKPAARKVKVATRKPAARKAVRKARR